MAEISALLGDAMRHTRALVTGLYPAGLENGLAEALGALVVKLARIYGTPVSFRGLGRSVAAHLFLIAREAAVNALRHGKPASVGIHLFREDGNIVLRVSDDGKNPAEESAASEGRGMDIMRYRSRLIGACLDIALRTGTGSSVTCSLPGRLAFGFPNR